MSVPTYPQIRDFLKKCNLLEYYDRFVSEGFDQLQSLLDVTEADLVAMDVKRGHRRRLQREIATMKGLPSNVPLPVFVQHGSGLEDTNDAHSLNISVPQKILYINNGPPSSNCGSFQSVDRSTRADDPPDPPDPPDNGSTKRKYKRHPKRDKNAPVKPLSAYVMFAHKVREEYNGRNISFPDMAKIVGDRWKNISPEEKELYETNAAKKKEDYQAKMAVYKTTEHWRKYQEYLKEFKEKYETNSRDQSKPRKRFKNDNSPDSDNPRSDYSSTRSTSVGYENGSGNTSSGSSNGNGNGNGNRNGNGNGNGRHNVQHQFSTGPYFNHGYPNYPPNPANYIPPYPHINPTVYGYTSEQNIGSSFVTPPPSIINTSTSNSAPSTSLADLYAKDDSSAGDDQSQQESSGNGNGSSFSGMGSSSSRSAEGQNSEDSSDSTASSNYINDTNDTPPAVTLEIDDNSQSQQQSSQNQHRHQDNQDNSTSSCKQKDVKD